MAMPYDHALLWIAESSLMMPLPEGWQEDEGGGGEPIYLNRELNVETSLRPQTLICRNLYRCGVSLVSSGWSLVRRSQWSLSYIYWSIRDMH